MLERDVGLGAGVRHLGVTSRADRFEMRGSPQNLDHDGLLGGAEGLHGLVVGGPGDVSAIDLEEDEERTNQQSSIIATSACCSLYLINQRHLARGCAEEPSFSIRASKGRGGTQKRSLRELMEDQRNEMRRWIK